MTRLVTALILAAALWSAAAPAAEADGGFAGYVPGRVLLTLAPEVSPQVAKSANGIAIDIPALDLLADRFQVRDMAPLYEGVPPSKAAGAPDLTRHWAVDFPPELDLQDVMAAYLALPEVVAVDPVAIFRVCALPDDPQLGSQWYLRNVALGQKDIRAVGGWAATHGDTNIVVAIVDSGVDWRHPDLGGSGPNYARGSIWINWDEYNGTPGVDDDANGKIDDLRGWDFVHVPGEGYPDEDDATPDNDPMDYEGHGTGCAGCASAITDNGTGISGTAWGCKVMAVRVGWLPNGASVGVVRMDFASQGMVYAAQNGAKVVNCSWGSHSYLSTAVNYCTSQGALVVTAAGNDNVESSVDLNVPSYLSSHAEVLAVAATEGSDGKASFSNYGTWVELSAPGTGITTTWYNRMTGQSIYTTVQGTSFSSPIACGAIALIWSAHPGWTRAQVRTLLLSTCDDLDAVNPLYAGKLGAGRPNLLRALGDGFLEVPDEFPSLLDAMNEGSAGDTVAVLSSFPIESGQTVIKTGLKILGGYAAGYGSRDPVATPTVVAGGPGGPALMFQAGATSALVMDGFRCTGGGGQQLASFPVSARYGGGVLVNGASPTLRNLEITGNAVGSSSEMGYGGGMALINSASIVEDCRIEGNTAVQGGGLYVWRGSPVLRGCQILDNVLVTDNGGATPRGGGVYALDAAPLRLFECRVGGHLEAEVGGGIFADDYLESPSLFLRGCEVDGNQASSKGGGIYVGGGAATIEVCEVHGNGRTPAATFMSGGGICAESATVTLDSLKVHGNDANIGGGVNLSLCPSGQVTSNVMYGNTGQLIAGALYYSQVASGGLTGNTFADNTTVVSGGSGVYLSSSSPVLSNNIAAFNTGPAGQGNGFLVAGGTPQFVCNLVWQNSGLDYGGITDQTGSNGNARGDPLFCSRAYANFAPQPDSPAAPANSGGCDLIGALAAAVCLVGVDPGEPGDLPPLVFRVEPAFPNPFNPSTTIRFSLAEAKQTTVRIYDLAGRLVRTLVDAPLPPAVHTVQWNGRDGRERAVPAGVYFYRVRSGTHEAVGRMALVK